METRKYDAKLFHKLIRKQRKAGNDFISDLHVGDESFHGDNNILYYIGITNGHWSLINSLHTNATTAVNWKSLVSEPYRIHQGIRQGGILSADLYKL